MYPIENELTNHKKEVKLFGKNFLLSLMLTKAAFAAKIQ